MMNVVNDLEFLRRDNANLLKEVHTLRLQSALLRERNIELERNLKEHLGNTEPHDNQDAKNVRNLLTTTLTNGIINHHGHDEQTDSTVGAADRWTLPKLRLDTNLSNALVNKPIFQDRKDRPETSWFDDSPTHLPQMQIQPSAPAGHPPTPPPPLSFPPPPASQQIQQQNKDRHPLPPLPPPPPSLPPPSLPPPPPPPDHPASSYRIPGINEINTIRGSRLIGEAPQASNTPKPPAAEEPPAGVHVPTVTPPSPDPSEGRGVPLPSLYSVTPPVTGVAVPHVSFSLLELKLIRKETYDSPAAVASFMNKLTRKEHAPQATYRSAFTVAFLELIPLLGQLSAEWIAFLHDFPSRIPATKRDSIVTIPMRESGSTILIGKNPVPPPPTTTATVRPTGPSPAKSWPVYDEPGFSAGGAIQSPITFNTYHTRRRSRSVDGYDLNRMSFLSVAGKGQNHVMVIEKTPASASTGLSPCERDAWVLLLALAYAAFPRSRVARRLRMLPITVKLQMIAWLPPTVNVYDNMCFASMTIDESLGQLWDAKKEILRLKHGWP